MNRRDFLKHLAAASALAASSRIIFDPHKNLWRQPELEWKYLPAKIILMPEDGLETRYTVYHEIVQSPAYPGIITGLEI